MPELPEVEGYRRFLQRHALGRTIESVSRLDPLVVGTLGRTGLDRVLPGRRFRETRRHGKYLFARAEKTERARGADSVWVVFHFGMSGSFEWIVSTEGLPRFSRVVFRFSGGRALVFACPRRFGRVAWVRSPEELVLSKSLGIDPLDPAFEPDGLRRALSGRRGAIKALLLDQTAVAGVGNLYADEALFQSSIDPHASGHALAPEEWKALDRALLRVLRRAIESGEDPAGLPRGWLLPRRRKGGACPRCGAPLEHTVIGGRTTYFCPRHQGPRARRLLKR